MKICVWLSVLFIIVTWVKEVELACFERQSNSTAILRLFNLTSEIGPPSSYFQLGNFGNDVNACESACSGNVTCVVYTLYLSSYNDTEWAGVCVGSTIAINSQSLQLLENVMSGTSYVCPDIRAVDFVMELPSSKLYQDVLTSVSFSTTFINGGAAREDIAPQTGFYDNFEVELLVTDSDVSRSGVSNYLGVDPAYPVYKEPSKLMQGLVIGGQASITVKGSADILVSATACSSWKYICVYIKGTPKSGFKEDPSELYNNHVCHDITAKKLCTNDHLDLSVQQLDITRNTLYSDGYAELLLAIKVDIGGSFVLAPNPDTVTQDYDVQLYLSDDEEISTALDLQIKDVPFSDTDLTKKFDSSGSLFLGGPTLKLPPLEVQASNTKYCGLSTLGVVIDPGSGPGKVVETNEDNNIMTIPVKVLCNADKWALSDVKFYTDVIYISTTQDILVDATVHNLQNVSYRGGRASFSLSLYLYDNAIFSTGSKKLELTQLGSVTYPQDHTPLRSIAPSGYVSMKQIKFSVEASVFTSNPGYTHLILEVVPVEGVDLLLSNSYVSHPVSIGAQMTNPPVTVSGFGIVESHVILTGYLTEDTNITFQGKVNLGSTNPSSLNLTLFWSKNQSLDNSDINSGIPIMVDIDGNISVSRVKLMPPIDKSFCGRLYGLLLNPSPQTINDYSLYYDDVLAVTSTVVLVCDASRPDKVALMELEMLDPISMWKPVTERTALGLRMRLACTSEDCSSTSVDYNNFAFYLDTDRSKDQETTVTSLTNSDFTRLDKVPMSTITLGTNPVVKDVRVLLEYTANPYCKANYRYLRVELTGIAENYTDNNWISIPINLHCLTTDTFNIEVGNSGVSISGSITDDPSFEGLLKISPYNAMLPKTDWPYVDMKWYYSEDSVINPNEDVEITFLPSQCQRQLLSSKIEAATDIDIKGNIESPQTGFESLCHLSNVYVGVAFNTQNLLPSIDIYSSSKTSTTTYSTASLGCNAFSNQQELSAEFVGDKTMPQDIYPFSSYILNMQVKVTNEYTSAMIGSGQSGNPDYTLEVFLSHDSIIDGDSIPVDITIAANDDPKRSQGIEAGSSVVFNVLVTIPFGRLNDTACEKLTRTNSSQMIVMVTNITVGGFSASSSLGTVPVSLICYLRLSPSSLTFNHEPTIWEDLNYDIGFKFNLTHEGHHTDKFSTTSDNFDVTIAFVSSNNKVIQLTSVTLNDPGVQRKVIKKGETISVSGNGTLKVASSGNGYSCADFDIARSLKLVVTPKGDLSSIGYTESDIMKNMASSMGINCSDTWLDLIANGIKLIDSSNTETNEMEVGASQATTVQISVTIDVGPSGTNMFTASSTNNYVYKLYLSRSSDVTKYQLDYTPTNTELKNKVQSDIGPFDLDTSGFKVPKNTATEAMCGAGYLIAALIDLKNKPSRKKRGVLPSEKDLVDDIIEPSHPADPKIRNNVVAKKVVLRCPGDLFVLSGVTILIGSIPKMNDAVLEFSATVTNSHYEGYNIPVSHNGNANFNFKIFGGGSEIALKDIIYLPSEQHKLTEALPAGGSVILTKVKVILDVDNTFCGNINSNSWQIQVVPGVGLPPGFVDEYDINDKLNQSGLTCDSNAYNFKATSVKFSTKKWVKDMRLKFELEVQVDPTSKVNQLPNPAVEMYINGVSFGNTNTPTKSASGNIATWISYLTLNESAWEKHCGVLSIKLMVDPENKVIETNENDNTINGTIPVECSKDLYGVHLDVKTESVLYPGTPVTLDFSGPVYNLESKDIAAASSDNPDNFAMKVYTQKGSVLNTLEAVDVTPDWRYFSDTNAPTYYRQEQDSDTAIVFSSVHSAFTLPSKVCTLGHDYLFVTAVPGSELKLANENTPYQECVFYDNYASKKFKCSTKTDGLDIAITSLRTGKKLFSIEGGNTLLLGESVPFTLEADIIKKGSASLPIPSDGSLPFGIAFYLKGSDGTEMRIPYEPGSNNVTVTTAGANKVIIGGKLTLDPEAFLKYCQQGSDLRVVIDPLNTLNEMDELNNEVVVKGVTVAGGTKDYCNQLDLIAEKLIIDPGYENDLLQSETDINFHLKYSIKKGLISKQDPASFVYQAVLSLDADWNNPTNRNLTANIKTHTVSGGLQIDFTAKIPVYIANDINNKFYHLFCGQSPYIGVWINLDSAVAEMNMTNNIVWRRFRLECGGIDGLAVSGLSLTSTGSGTTIKIGSNTVTMQVDVLNKGTGLSDASTPGTNIFDLKLYATSKNSLESEIPLSSTVWENDQPRGKGMLKWSARVFDNVNATFTISQQTCIETTYLCVEVLRGIGMMVAFADLFDGDNFKCYDVVNGKIKMDCGRDLSLSQFELSLPSVAKIYKDNVIDITFNVTLGLTDQSFAAQTKPYLGVEILLSDGNIPTPGASFNGGNPLVLVKSTDIMWSNPSKQVLERTMVNGAVNVLRGSAKVFVPGQFCDAAPGARYICIKWVPLMDFDPAIRDTNPVNNYQCLAGSKYLDCTRDTLDLKPVQFDLGNGLAISNTMRKFSIEVEVDIGSADKEGPVYFMTDLYLSLDKQIDETDMKLEAEGFLYGSSAEEMRRNLKVGKNTIDIGFDGFMVPGNLVTPNVSLCGDIFIIADIDSGKVIPETDENNNIIVAPITTICTDDVFMLTDVSLSMMGKMLYAEEETVLQFDMTVMNMRNQPTPIPSPSSPNFYFKVYAIWYNSGVEQMTEISTSAHVTYPQGYYRHMMPLERVRYKGVRVMIQPNLFTIAVCRVVTKLKFQLIPALFDNKANQEVTVDLPMTYKRCNAATENTQLLLGYFNTPYMVTLPAQVNVDIGITSMLWIGASSGLLQPNSFINTIYVSRDSKLDTTKDYKWRVLHNTKTISQGFSSLDFSTVLALQTDDSGKEYCGHTNVIVVVDTDNDLIEPSERDHIGINNTIFICSNDYFGISDVSLVTFDQQIVEGTTMAFKLNIKVTCTKVGCSEGGATEYIKLKLTSKTSAQSSETQLAIINSNWGGSKGESVTPSLGSSYLYTGYQNNFVVEGFFIVGQGGCAMSGENIITVKLEFGSDLSSALDGVPENNAYSFMYKCIKPTHVDFVLENFNFFDGETFIPEKKSKFTMKMRIEPQLKEVNIKDPFKIGFWLSEDGVMSGDDYWMNYEMSDCVNQMVEDLTNKTTVNIDEYTGLYIPTGFCGEWYIIGQIDSTKVYIETSEDNNYLSKKIDIKCQKDVLSLDIMTGSPTLQIWYNVPTKVTMDISIENLGKPIKGCSPPCEQMALVAVFSANDVLEPVHDMPLDVKLDEEHQKKLQQKFEASETINLKSVEIEVVLPAPQCLQYKYLIVGILLNGEYKYTEDLLINNYRALPLNTMCTVSPDLRYLRSVLSQALIIEKGDRYIIGFDWDATIEIPPQMTLEPFMVQWWLSDDSVLDKNQDLLLDYKLGNVMNNPFTASTTKRFNSRSDNSGITKYKKFCNHGYFIVELDPYNEIVEINRKNNVHSELTTVNCFKQYYGSQISLEDMFSTSDLVVSVLEPGPIWPEQQYTLTVNITVTCNSNCPGKATSSILAFSVHYTLELKVYDIDLTEVSSLTPGVINGYWVADASGDKNELTKFIPTDGLQADFSSPKVNIEFQGLFSISPGGQCDKVRYLGVSLKKGDSQQVLNGQWGITENDIKYVPWTLHCEQEPVDLKVQTFQINGQSMGGTLNVNLNSLTTLDMVLTASSTTGFWPKTKSGIPMFDFKLFVSEGPSKSTDIDLMYEVPENTITVLSSTVPKGAILTLSNNNASIDKTQLARVCGIGEVYIGVVLDVYDQIEEPNSMNNLGFIKTIITGCQEGFDLIMNDVDIPEFVTSAQNMRFDVGITFSYIGGSTAISIDVDSIQNMNLTMEIYSDGPKLVNTMKPEITSSVLNDSVLTSQPNRAVNMVNNYTGMVQIPGDFSLCDHSWLIKIKAEWMVLNDSSQANNVKWKQLFIGCPVDGLALESYEFNVNLNPGHFIWWPILKKDIKVRVKVKNMANVFKKNETVGLFAVALYFSLDDVLDRDTDHKTKVKLNNADFLESNGIVGLAAIQTPWLTGSLQVPTMGQCLEAKFSNTTPTLFVDMEVPYPPFSVFKPNDAIAVPLDESIFKCIDGQVDLSVSSFVLSKDPVPPNTDLTYTLKIGITKTPSGTIADADAQNTNDLSMSISFFLSLDNTLSSDDVLVPVVYSSSQISQLRQGVQAALSSPAEYTLDGEKFNINLNANPNWQLYCGQAYIIVQIKDLKNDPPIDPNMSNNKMIQKIHLECLLDTIALDNFSVMPISPQNVIYSGINAMVQVNSTVWNYGDSIPKSVSGRDNFHLVMYMSPDRKLNLDLDSKVTIVSVPADWPKKSLASVPKKVPIALNGPVEINIPVSACTSRYMILSLYKGVDVLAKDNIYPDNMRYVDIKEFLKCSVDYVDFSVKTFTLTQGNIIEQGAQLSFKLLSYINVQGSTSLGNGQGPVFAFQFLLSKDDKFDNTTDISFKFTGIDQNTILSKTFTGPIDVNMDSTAEKLVVPSVSEDFCGRVYLLIVLDVHEMVEERSEYNNVQALPVTLTCTGDVLSLHDVKVGVPDMFYKNWASLVLSLTTSNVLDTDIMSSTNSPVIDINVYVKQSPTGVTHDITPAMWKMSGQTINNTMTSRGDIVLNNLIGQVDVTKACWPDARFQWLETGTVYLVTEVTITENVTNIDECVVDNNSYMMKINVDCSSDAKTIDLKADNFVVDGGPILKLGLNPVTIVGTTRVTGGVVGSGFKYSFIVSAGGLYRMFDSPTPFDNSAGGEFQIKSSNALDLTSNARFLCNYNGAISVKAVIDRQDDLMETDEMNNDFILTGLSIDPTYCTDAIDIAAEDFKVNGLFAKPNVPTEFTLKASVTTTGVKSVHATSGDSTIFSWSFVLSTDDKLDSGDTQFHPGVLSSQQKSQLQAGVSQHTTSILTLNGNNLVIPLTKETQPYCWKHPYIGVLLNNGKVVTENNENNNAKFYRIVFDCGDKVNECALNLASCSVFANCKDEWYNLTTYIGEPYTCTCKDGFQGDGRTCTDKDECSGSLQLCSGITHSVCKNHEGGYECKCQTGYKPAINTFGQLSACADLDECSNSSLFQCNSNANCVNTAGSYSCSCKDGFTGDGFVNCTDIVDCQSDSCRNNGTCVEGVMGFSCQCLQGFDGPRCDMVHGLWSPWSGWSNCMGDCGAGFASRTRQCDDPAPENGGRPCSRVKFPNKQHTPCDVRGCDAGHIPWKDYNPCFDKYGGGFTLYLNKGKSYKCECVVGYKKLMRNGKFSRCEDENECTMTVNGIGIQDCDVNATCINKPGTFECVCNQGYEGSGRECKDTNECSSMVNPCPANAQCINTVGSYYCVCKDGYKVADPSSAQLTCLENRLWPYGSAVGDTEVNLESDKSTLTKERASKLIKIPNGLPVFGGNLYNSLYISENGLLVITDDILERNGRETYRYPTPLKMEAFNGSDPLIKGFLAPFWADSRSNSRFHKIWYNSYTDTTNSVFSKMKQLLQEGLNIAFDAKFILKVTWDNMAPIYSSETSERNTFQLLLATNGIHSYTVYIYEDGGMRWNPSWMYRMPELLLANKGFPARIGYIIKGADPNTYYEQENNNSAKWSTFEQKPNAYRVSEKMMQSHDKEGFLFYQLDNNTNTFQNPMQLCQMWYQAEGDIKTWSSDILNTCPNNKAKAIYDNRLQLVMGTSNNITCYHRILPNVHGASFKCCYDSDDGSIIDAPLTTEYRDIGFLTKYTFSEDQSNQHYLKDVLPYEWCCIRSNTQNYCDMYKERRPVMTADSYHNVKSSWGQGSVHLRTLDGGELDVLSYGEYVWLRSKTGSAVPVMIQLRTDMSVYQASSSSKAVIVSAVSAKVGSQAPSLQAYLNNARDSIDVWVDNQLYNNQTLTDAIVMKPGPTGRPKRSTSSKVTTVTFLFEAGISLTIYLYDKELSVVVQVPSNLKDMGLEGLMGNMDGVITNDFTTEAGDVFNAGSTAAEIFSYTLTWQLRNLYGATNADANTIFHHYTTPSSANNYFKAAFTPIFFVPADYSNQETTTCKVGTSVNWQCAYDYKVTGQSTLGVKLIENTAQWIKINTLLTMTPPIFDINTPKRVEADAGITKKLTLKATDDEAVTIGITEVNLETMIVKEIHPYSHTSSGNLYTSVFRWIPGQYKAHLIFHATDASGSKTTMTPEYSVCNCQHAFVCDQNIPSSYKGSFRFGQCKCRPAYAGEFCDQDLNGCLVKHCYGQCTLRTPAQVSLDYLQYEFSCSPCPTGMEGDGVTCSDVNECVLPSSDPRKHNCQQNCLNTAGGFLCGCDPGYILGKDGYTCVDVKQCGTSADNCDKAHGTCKDAAGTFTCGCKSGFSLAADGKTCVDINECEKSNGHCSRLCVNSIGSYYCECGYGYTLDANNNTNCVPTDTCDTDVMCHQKCTNMTSWYECQCNSDYVLQPNDWECKPIHPCAVNTCDQLLGICSKTNQQTVCSCPKGKQLSNTDRKTCVDINECTTGDHQCGANSQCINQVEVGKQYYCLCNTGYTHSTFSDKECVNINECELQGANPCMQICTDSQGSYTCDCYSGYILGADGKSCTDIDECAPGVPNLCDINAKCTNLNGSYTCQCNTGYTGDGYVCDELNECTLDNGGCAHACHNTIGSYYCSCLTGYMLEMDRKTCTDINECMKPSINCKQSCVNTVPGYYCTCWNGYVLNSDGFTCDVTQPCSGQQWCDHGGSCSMASGKPLCVCDHGYVLNTGTGRCQDLNECITPARRKKRSLNNSNITVDMTTDTANIPTTTTGITTTTVATTTGPRIDYIDKCEHPLSTCKNKAGSYACQCAAGYDLRPDGFSCMDIDECVSNVTNNAHKCNLNTTTCANTQGSYKCNCKPGFRLDTNFNCKDIDECDSDDVAYLVCSSNANCVNSPGSFSCSCKSGFHGDGVSCTDIDECNYPTLNKCSANQTCVNKNGTFDCSCKPGFKPQVKKPNTCLDINECDSTSLNSCKLGCQNSVGSFRCTCPIGYQLNPFDGRSCEIAEECDSDIMKQQCQQDCVRQNNADYCHCSPGYFKDNLLCHDINECEKKDKNKCGDHTTCKNTNGSYECVCHRDYIPDSDGLDCSQTNGNWGAWSNWDTCSETCNGRRTRKRLCDMPEPSEGRNCKGINTQYAMCNYDMPKCYSLAIESEKSLFVDFAALHPELWESVAASFRDGLCKSFNFYCWQNAQNYERCCNKPLTNINVLQLRKDYCMESYIKLGRGYPRSYLYGSRIMIYIEMPVNNPLCGTLSGPVSTPVNVTVVNAGRKKRSITEQIYTMPKPFLEERLNSNDTRGNISQEVKKNYDAATAAGMLNYNVLPAMHEDYVPTTPPPVVESTTFNLVIVILAVIFSVVGICVLAVVLFFLVRPAPKGAATGEEGIKGTALQMFEQKDDEAEDSEDEAIRKVFENHKDEDEDDDLDIEKQRVMSPKSVVEDDDETALHPHRPRTGQSQASSMDQCEDNERTISQATYREITEGKNSDENENDNSNEDASKDKDEDANESEEEQNSTARSQSHMSNKNENERPPSSQSERSNSSGERAPSEISRHSVRDPLL